MRMAWIAVLVPLWASCASSGLYNMSDSWCTEHPSASVARCPKKDAERHVSVNNREHGTDSESATDN